MAGTAANGREALDLLPALNPDVICTDLRMPLMDGLEFTRAVMNKYRSIFANARDGSMLIDADSGLVAECNPEFEKQCGRPLADLKSLHTWELRPAAQREAARHKFEEILAAGEGGSSKLNFERPDGTQLQIEFVSRRILIGNHDYIQSIGRDITERQRAEQEIRTLNAELDARVDRRTIELEAANQELEASSYSVSHDLRAPLRAIDGFSRKAIMAYGDKLDEEGRHQLQVVRNNAQRMGKLIDDLLAFSCTGRREMAWQQLDMDAIVRSIADGLRAAEPQRAIEFAFSPLPQASGDAVMLRQVWVNLLGNAVKFSCRRQVAHIEVGGRNEGGESIYWIKDDGAGFDMQYVDKLFDMFQRLHREDEFEGIGVGLAIAQRILQRHNGRIWGEGHPNAGATFCFALPLPAPDKAFSGGQAA